MSKRFKNLLAVDDISLGIYQGEIFGLLGPNGAGKTTTIRMLCGLLAADSGLVTVKGIPISSGYTRVKSLIGLCPQEIVLWQLLTCFEQMRFVGISYGLTARTARNRAETLLDTLGLSEKRNSLAHTLSGGMQRRLNIALALVHDPELIVLDEAQAGLDPQSRILVRDFIRQRAKKKTVILTTHDMDEADRLADRVAIMDHGKILMVDLQAKVKDKTIDIGLAIPVDYSANLGGYAVIAETYGSGIARVLFEIFMISLLTLRYFVIGIMLYQKRILSKAKEYVRGTVRVH